jgi:hypothetical protein
MGSSTREVITTGFDAGSLTAYMQLDTADFLAKAQVVKDLKDDLESPVTVPIAFDAAGEAKVEAIKEVLGTPVNIPVVFDVDAVETAGAEAGKAAGEAVVIGFEDSATWHSGPSVFSQMAAGAGVGGGAGIGAGIAASIARSIVPSGKQLENAVSSEVDKSVGRGGLGQMVTDIFMHRMGQKGANGKYGLEAQLLSGFGLFGGGGGGASLLGRAAAVLMPVILGLGIGLFTAAAGITALALASAPALAGIYEGFSNVNGAADALNNTVIGSASWVQNVQALGTAWLGVPQQMKSAVEGLYNLMATSNPLAQESQSWVVAMVDKTEALFSKGGFGMFAPLVMAGQHAFTTLFNIFAKGFGKSGGFASFILHLSKMLGPALKDFYGIAGSIVSILGSFGTAAGGGLLVGLGFIASFFSTLATIMKSSAVEGFLHGWITFDRAVMKVFEGIFKMFDWLSAHGLNVKGSFGAIAFMLEALMGISYAIGIVKAVAKKAGLTGILSSSESVASGAAGGGAVGWLTKIIRGVKSPATTVAEDSPWAFVAGSTAGEAAGVGLAAGFTIALAAVLPFIGGLLLGRWTDSLGGHPEPGQLMHTPINPLTGQPTSPRELITQSYVNGLNGPLAKHVTLTTQEQTNAWMAQLAKGIPLAKNVSAALTLLYKSSVQAAVGLAGLVTGFKTFTPATPQSARSLYGNLALQNTTMGGYAGYTEKLFKAGVPPTMIAELATDSPQSLKAFYDAWEKGVPTIYAVKGRAAQAAVVGHGYIPASKAVPAVKGHPAVAGIVAVKGQSGMTAKQFRANIENQFMENVLYASMGTTPNGFVQWVAKLKADAWSKVGGLGPAARAILTQMGIPVGHPAVPRTKSYGDGEVIEQTPWGAVVVHGPKKIKNVPVKMAMTFRPTLNVNIGDKALKAFIAVQIQASQNQLVQILGTGSVR